jgi:hypothetical protein
MPEQRRRFSAQFKAEAVQMVIETGKPIASVARDLGIHDRTFARVAFDRPDGPVPVYLTLVAERSGRSWQISHYHVSKILQG